MIDLSRFCEGHDEQRLPYLSAPIYGTDFMYGMSTGRCVQLVDHVLAVERPRQIAPDHIADALEGLFRGAEARPYGPIPLYPRKRSNGACSVCQGVGRGGWRDGVDGFDIFDTGIDAQCKNCHGTGEDYENGISLTQVCGVYVNELQLRPFLDLPDVTVCAEGCDQLFFRFRGGYGSLMGISEPEKCRGLMVADSEAGLYE